MALHWLLHSGSSLCVLPRPLQLQGMQVLHDTQLRELPGYQGDAVMSAAGVAGGRV